ncbi:MAG: hypothetical protein JWO80_3180, partial [Bryobacterales bacterium]|nr:hypothetical protein [Bryobacterales bacterium]
QGIYDRGGYCRPGMGTDSGGRIVGTVTDPSGAHVSNVSVVATNEKTGQERKVLSNENGQYTITQLEPSTYSLGTSRTGVSDMKCTGLSLEVGQEITGNLGSSSVRRGHSSQCRRRHTGAPGPEQRSRGC